MLTKSSTELVRQQNSALVLAALRRWARISRIPKFPPQPGSPRRRCRRSRPSWSAPGVIAKAEQHVQGGRGRPRVLFAPAPRLRLHRSSCVSPRMWCSIRWPTMAGTLLDRFEEAPQSRPARHGRAFARRPSSRRWSACCSRSRLDKRDRVLAISISSKGLVDADRRGGCSGRRSSAASSSTLPRCLQPEWRARVMLNNETLLVAQALAAEGGAREDGGFRCACRHLARPQHRAWRCPQGQVRRARRDGAEFRPHAACGHRLACAAAAPMAASRRLPASTGFCAPPSRCRPTRSRRSSCRLPKWTRSPRARARGIAWRGYAFRQAGIALGNGISRMLSLYEPYADLRDRARHALLRSPARRVGGGRIASRSSSAFRARPRYRSCSTSSGSCSTAISSVPWARSTARLLQRDSLRNSRSVEPG